MVYLGKIFVEKLKREVKKPEEPNILERWSEAFERMFQKAKWMQDLSDVQNSWLCELYKQLTRLHEEDEVDVPIYTEHREMRKNRVSAHPINHKTQQVITLEISCRH